MIIDNLANRYKLLPSEVLASSDLFDVYVMDTALSWERYQQEIEDRKSKGMAPPAPRITQDEMLRMMEQVKKYEV